jgi:hypothetical protein
MTTLDHLDRWLAEGTLSTLQHDAIAPLVRRQRVSVFVELNALLYLGVLCFAAGLAWTANVYAAQWGDAAILAPATALVAGCLYYCFSRAAAYSPVHVPAPSLAFDYVLYLACLVFAIELGYVEYRFHLIEARWDDALLASAAAYFLFAYRFDNRFVLSLGIATLGGWFGVRVAHASFFVAESSRLYALAYGLVVGAAGGVLYAGRIKQHFLESYLHVAANVVLAALLWGDLAGGAASPWFVALLAASAAAIVGGIRFRRFAFVVYGVGYGYIGVSRLVLNSIHDASSMLSYIVFSAGLVVIGLVVLARKFGREA